jgi:hypothetical protein
MAKAINHAAAPVSAKRFTIDTSLYIANARVQELGYRPVRSKVNNGARMVLGQFEGVPSPFHHFSP